ncbi:MAG: BamA/TamA family outer membrane protein [Pseudomonadota bacterium]
MSSAVLICAFLLPTGDGNAAILRYNISAVGEKLPAALRENIRAYLGDIPEETLAGERVLRALPSTVADAGRALGFYNLAVQTQVDRTRSPWRVEITVDPGPVVLYENVDFRLLGDASQDSPFAELVASSAPKEGERLHHGAYQSFKERLLSLAWQRGFFDAHFVEHVVQVDAKRNEASLKLWLDSGVRYRFGPVSFDELMITDTRLGQLMTFSTDDYYFQQALFDSRQRIQRLGYYAGVTFAPDIERRSEGYIPIKLELDPAPAHSFEVGVGYSTDTDQRISLAWQSPHLNRYGHSQETVLRWSPVNPELRLSYTLPLDPLANDLLQLGGRLEENEYGDLESEQREISVRLEQLQDEQIVSFDSRWLDERWGVFSNRFTARLALFGASFSKRSRSGPATDPNSGLSQYYRLDGATASLASDQDLLRAYGKLTAVKRLNSKWRAVGRIEAGWLYAERDQADELPPSLAFFAGGDSSIRGFAYQSLGTEAGSAQLTTQAQRSSLTVGGSRLLTASAELQRYLGENWRVSSFVDAGDAFNEDDFENNVGVGLGVHYLSPVGALRLEIASPVSENASDVRLHINIGAEF